LKISNDKLNCKEKPFKKMQNALALGAKMEANLIAWRMKRGYFSI
jgi:hypothetical protein